MTKMISKISTETLVEHEEFADVLECLVSNNKLELIEMVVDRMKTMKEEESVLINLVNKPDDEDELALQNCIAYEKGEIIYQPEAGCDR